MLAVVVIVAASWLRPQRDSSVEEPERLARVNSIRDAAASQARSGLIEADKPHRGKTGTTTQSAVVRRESSAIAAPTLERGFSGQTYVYRHDFRGGIVDKALFSKMDKVEATPEGFRIAKNSKGEHETIAVLESRPIPTQIAINAVGPHWAETLPDGTGIQLEISTSSDGVNWTDWQRAEVDSDSVVEPTFPDGTTNPNFGDTIGTLISRTDNFGTFIRYRATLTTEDGTKSPVLARVSLNYQDSSDPDSTVMPEPEPVKAQ